MVKIRLKRMGAKKNPHYRIVVTDSRRARDGAYIESIGSYDPRDQKAFTFDVTRLDYWLGNGAQMTPRVKALVRLNTTKKSDEVIASLSNKNEPVTRVNESETSEVEGGSKPEATSSEGGSDEGTA